MKAKQPKLRVATVRALMIALLGVTLSSCMGPAQRSRVRQETRVETRTENRMERRGW